MEILNIEYHTIRLLIKALNQERTQEAAAQKLGLNVRTVCRLIVEYNIEYNEKSCKYFTKKMPNHIIMMV